MLEGSSMSMQGKREMEDIESSSSDLHVGS